MIRKLKIKLTWLFLAATMLVFTGMQLFMLQYNVKVDRVIELGSLHDVAFSIQDQLNAGVPIKNLDLDRWYNDGEGCLIFVISDGQVLRENTAVWGAQGEKLLKQVEVGQRKGPSSGGHGLRDGPSVAGQCFQVKGENRVYELTTAGYPYDLRILRPGQSDWKTVSKYFKEMAKQWILMLAGMVLVSPMLAYIAAKPVEASIKSQRNFVAAASHELKAPMAVIQVNAETLGTGDTGKKRRVILEECGRMTGLIHSLLALASSDSGNLKLYIQSVDVDTMMIKVWEAFEENARRKQIRLQLDIGEHYPKLLCDEERLRQALGILIDNAICFSPRESSIYLGVRVEKGAVVFSVIDHGPGIPDSEKKKVFDRFYSCDPSRTDKNHYGLGLSIAQEIVKAHHGTLRLTDTPSGGCTAEIGIPIQKGPSEKANKKGLADS